MRWIKRIFKGLSKNTVLLAFASLFSDISTEMLYPILPIFLTQTLHANGSIVGLVEGIAQATQNIIQGFSGWLSDKLQKRKTVALIGYFFAALSKPLMGMSRIWPEVLGGRFLDRLSTGVRSAPRDALIAGSVTKEHRGKAFGLEGIGDNLGACLGPLLTLVLISFLFIDIRSIFYIAFIPGLLAFILILFVKENITPASEKITIFPEKKLPRQYWYYLGVIGLCNLGNFSNAFLILQTHSIDASLQTTIMIYAGFNLMAALVSYPAGFISDLFGRKKLLVIAFIILFCTYLGFAFSHNIFITGVLFILYGVHQGIFRGVGKAFSIDFVPTELHATAVGWYSTVIGITQLIASVVAGLLWDHVSHATVFFYGASFALIGTLGLLFFIPRKISLL